MMNVKQYVENLFAGLNITDIVLAAVGCIALFVTVKQAQISKEQFHQLQIQNQEITRNDEAANVERHAWLALGIDDTPKLQTGGKDTAFIIEIKNDGHTPARNIALHAILRTLLGFKDEKELDRRLSRGADLDNETEGFVKSTFIPPLPSGESFQHKLLAAIPINAEQLASVKDGSHDTLFFHVLVTYEDMDKKPHTTESYFQIKWNGETWIFQPVKFHNRLD